MPPDTKHEYRFTDQIGHLLRRAYQRHVAIFRETVPDAQLTAAQFVVLCAVRDHPRSQVQAIVKTTAIDEPTVRGVVERLKWRQLVTVTHEPGDARRMEVELAPAGAALVAETVPVAERITELTYGNLDGDERRTLVGLLRKMSGIERSDA